MQVVRNSFSWQTANAELAILTGTSNNTTLTNRKFLSSSIVTRGQKLMDQAIHRFDETLTIRNLQSYGHRKGNCMYAVMYYIDEQELPLHNRHVD